MYLLKILPIGIRHKMFVAFEPALPSIPANEGNMNTVWGKGNILFGQDLYTCTFFFIVEDQIIYKNGVGSD
jgi:hypothetical protein